MRINAQHAMLGVVGLSTIAVMACTTTITTDNGDAAGLGFGDDAASMDGTTSTPDAATGAPDGSDAATCGVTTHISAACDQCLATKCCSPLESCYGTAADATTACETLLSCIQDTEAGRPDAGIAPMSQSDAVAICAPDAGSTYTAGDVSNALAVLNCLGDSDAGARVCASSCAQ